LERELTAEKNVEVTLIKGEKGAFEVRLNDELIFSKHEHKRFPGEGEILGLLTKQGVE